MATGTAPPSTSDSQEATASSGYDQIIQKQLARTGWQVKTVDLLSSAILYVTGVLVFFLTTVLIDHWVMGLGFWGRLFALGLFLGGSGYYLFIQIAKAVRRINPVYAARVIEQSTPSLKNSLVNMLMFRPSGTPIHQLVMQALQQKAASDLTQVSPDSSVDRSPLIKLGYLLVGVLTICAAYKILSPKDPLQTVSRVIAPWSNIARPSRVQIEDIQPGDKSVFYGQTVKVSAKIDTHGLRTPGPVTLYYSTADGQIIDRPVPMNPTPESVRHEAQLPPSGAGLQQDVTYYIVADDAISPKHRLTVIPAPTITVERLDLNFPTYTGRPKQTLERQGDINALEGTRVSVFAKANQKIKSAYIEFDPPSMMPVASAKLVAAPRVEMLSMKVDEDSATGTFILELAPDRRTPKRSSYQVRFVTEEGHRNDQPILHQIQVIPDLPPEIEILTPTQDRVNVPENGRQKIEVRAVDPDFGISKITLRAVAGGNDVLTFDIVRDAKGRSGQLVAAYDFVPLELHLKAGDEVTYWVNVEDNRTAPTSGLPEPNSQRTRNHVIRIVAADESQRSNNPSADKRPDNAPDKNANPNNSDSEKSDSSNNRNNKNEKDKNQNEKSNSDENGSNNSNNGGKQGKDKKDSKDGDQGTKGNSDANNKQGQDKQDKNGNENQKEKNQEGGNSANQNQDKKNGKKNDKNSGGKEDDKGDGKKDKNQQQGGNKSGSSKSEKAGNEKSENEQGGQGQSGKSDQGKNDNSGAGNDPSQSGSNSSKNGNNKSGGDNKTPAPANAGDNKSPSQNSSPDKNGNNQQPATGQEAGGSKEGVPRGDAQNAGGPKDGQKDDGSARREAPHDGEVFEKALENLLKKQKEKEKENGTAGSENKANSDNKSGADNKSGEEKSDGKPGTNADGGKKTDDGGQPKSPADKQGQQGQPDKQGQSAKSGPMDKQDKNSSSAHGEKTKPDGGGKPMADGDNKPSGSNDPNASKPKKSVGPPPMEKGGDTPPQGGDKNKGNGASGIPMNEDGEGGKPQGPGDPKGDGAGKNSGNGTKPTPGKGQNSQPGAGQQSKDAKGGSPEAQDTNQDRDKKGDSSSDKPMNSDEATSPSTSKKQSDSKGGKDGTESGGGGKGGGQSGNQQGNDSAGKNTPSDEGANQSDEKGNGDDSKRPGDQKKSADKTGKSGTDKGPGSSSAPADGSPDKTNDPSKNPGASKGPGASNGIPNGGGLPSDNQPVKNAPPTAVPDGDAANLEYARKATDMALEHLKNQKDNPDRELLDKLGWSKDDLKKFLDRWESMKRSASSAKQQDAKRDLDESLRSLGLRPQKDAKRGGGAMNDTQRGNRDSGTRSAPPSSYQEQFNAFRKGTTRAKDD